MRLFFCFLFLTVPVFSWAGTAASQITEGAGEEPVLPAEVKATPVLVSFYKIDWPEGEKQFVRRVTKDFRITSYNVCYTKLLRFFPFFEFDDLCPGQYF